MIKESLVGSLLKLRKFQKLCRSSRPEVFCETLFLNVSQNSQENTCVRVSFLIKLQA